MDPLDFVPKKNVVSAHIPHYYGYFVRRLFLTGGILILVALPFNNDILPIGIPTTTFLVVILILFAALTNHFQKWVAVVNVGTSIFAVLAFEYFAVSEYSSVNQSLFIVRQVLAIIFLFALYYSGKTLRAMLLKQIHDNVHDRDD